VADLQGTLDAIAEVAVHRCGYCDEPLSSNAPSPDFCGQFCQRAWTEQQAEIVALVGYREPNDLAAYASNLVELHSPEVTPQHPPLPEFGITFHRSSRLPDEAVRELREAFEQAFRQDFLRRLRTSLAWEAPRRSTDIGGAS
jgi:hypothetical protein